MKTSKLVLFVLVTFLMSMSAKAQQGQRQKQAGQREFKKEMPNRQEFRKKGTTSFLNEEQKEKAKTLRLETAKKIKPLMNEINELKAKQRTLTTSADPNMKAIYSNIDAMSAKQAEVVKIKAAQNQEMRKMLDEEQLLKYDMMRNKPKQGNRTSPQQMRRR